MRIKNSFVCGQTLFVRTSSICEPLSQFVASEVDEAFVWRQLTRPQKNEAELFSGEKYGNKAGILDGFIFLVEFKCKSQLNLSWSTSLGTIIFKESRSLLFANLH